ncbi:fatty acid hydroxylase family protein [Bacillus sp. RO2]|jgi:sterol desaturase/sphingolipid hydroxylase (fatty acid hydroxylase superfamily)|uniref:sterol desaturase family protein n=1 Tax=Bacillus sp. RO2 TaxID=2723913 RepID=UPI00145E3FEE|nr:sterol desaturase family protein [Bacillus sp. RO2]NMH73462.1 fatty acid hydroxylase family protein [Bacillus sp. RO2]
MKGYYREFFLFPDITVLMMLIVASMGWLGWSGLTWGALAVFVSGMLTFMFSEYLTHRFVFHLKPPKNPFLLKLLKRLHYDHHTHPNDLHLLFLPLWYSMPNLSVLALIFYLIAGSWGLTVAFTCGLMMMLFIYEWKHYVAHRPIKPRTKFGKWVKKTHILHHFKNENFWYGVSTPFVDVLFGTLKNEKEVETSKTAKDLEKRV